MSSTVTAVQCRMGRAALNWNQQKLAQEARVGLGTVRHLELGKDIGWRLCEAIRATFEGHNINFVGEAGVLYRPAPKKSRAPSSYARSLRAKRKGVTGHV